MAQQQSPEVDVQSLVDQAMAEAMAGGGDESSSAQAGEAAQVEMPEVDVGAAEEPSGKGIELLSDVDLHVKIELGRTQMLVEDVLRLGEGAVVELDKLAGDPVDVYVNEQLIARGEVLVLNDNFCIRISEIVANLEEESEQAQAVAAGEGSE